MTRGIQVDTTYGRVIVIQADVDAGFAEIQCPKCEGNKCNFCKGSGWVYVTLT